MRRTRTYGREGGNRIGDGGGGGEEQETPEEPLTRCGKWGKRERYEKNNRQKSVDSVDVDPRYLGNIKEVVREEVQGV